MLVPDRHGLDSTDAWDTELAFVHLKARGLTDSKVAAERCVQALGLFPPALDGDSLSDEAGRKPIGIVVDSQIEQAGALRRLVLFAQINSLYGVGAVLHCNDAHGGRSWTGLGADTPDTASICAGFARIQRLIGKSLMVFPSGEIVRYLRQAQAPEGVRFSLTGYPPVLPDDMMLFAGKSATARETTPHLKRLEAESIHIIREAVAEAENPVMLYSVGKDSSVMLHLARKAFFPAPPPFPLLHVDTRWKFQEMYLMRDYMARESGMDLLVHVNPEAIEKDINPFIHGSALHTHITKTEGLKQALDHNRFDVVFGGARRDEEKSRAKERIFSFRTESHHWDPKSQRPELWNLFNTRKKRGESIRVFPLSNWTELDIWQYIYQESIPVVLLYFAAERPVVERNGMLMMIDDDRVELLPGERIEVRNVRFRTLGCYPLTGAIESTAANLPEIILELAQARKSEREGRAIDKDGGASMEKKKQEGYF